MSARRANHADLWADVKRLPAEGSLTLEVSALHADGERRTMELSAVNLMSNVAVAGIVLTLRDVTANRTLERQLSYRADHDSLTGLANRANFLTRVSDELQRGNLPTVMFLDLDDFKAINDGLGHSAGDVLLRTVADRLKVRFANASNLVARLGGDEFGIMLVDSSTAEASVLAQQAIGDLKDSIQVNDFQSVSVSGCIGIAVAEAKNSASDLMRHADLAMYRAKQLGKGQVEGFDADLGRQTERRNEYKRDLMAALGRDQLYLVYQPIVRLSDGRTVGAEALLRWDHHIFGNVPPNDFIPLAEQTGVIIPIGAWAIEQACMSAMGWADDTMFVTVNVSGVQLRETTFVDGRATQSGAERPGCRSTGPGDHRIDTDRRQRDCRRPAQRASLVRYPHGAWTTSARATARWPTCNVCRSTSSRSTRSSSNRSTSCAVRRWPTRSSAWLATWVCEPSPKVSRPSARRWSWPGSAASSPRATCSSSRCQQ